MRICLVSSSFYPATFYGGPVFATWGLSKTLAQTNIQMYISTTNANGKSRVKVKTNKFIKKGNNLFVKYYHEQFINKFSFSFIYGVWDDIKRADVVYIQYLFHYTVLFSLFFSLYHNKKIILCPRGSFSRFTLSNRLSYFKLIWLKLFIKPFCKFITWHASSYLEEIDIKRELSSASVEVINDGVDFNSFQQFKRYDRIALLQKYTGSKFEDVSKIFFSMGRLHQIKAFDLLIDSFSIFIKKEENAKLIIAGGDDGTEKKLEQQIRVLGLENSVFLIGAVSFSDKRDLLNNCDYFTLASRFESFGIVIAEALSCGKPVVLSNKTPWKDLEKNKCGILVAPNRRSFTNAFSEITTLRYDSKLIKKYAKQNYDWKVISDSFLKIIKN